MNNQFQNAYVDALLADASYVDILDLSNPVGVLTPRVTQAQAQFINANFEVRDQQLSPNGGFDAVVWRGKSGTPFAGKSYVWESVVPSAAPDGPRCRAPIKR